MVSFKSALLAATMAFASIAKAQYYIVPSSVPLSTRENWCASEISTCPLICQQITSKKTLVNDCNADSLTYGCLCGNNQQPNISEYSLTLPFFICQEFVVQCRTKCGIDNTCASNCATDNPCGATDPKRYNTTSTASSSPTAPPTSTSAGPDTIFTGTPGGGSSTSSGKGKSMAAPAVEVGKAYGLAVLFGSMFVGFAML